MTYVQEQCKADSARRLLTQRRKDAKKGKTTFFLGQKNCPALRALRLCASPPLSAPGRGIRGG
jgi:hypothetical protein